MPSQLEEREYELRLPNSRPTEACSAKAPVHQSLGLRRKGDTTDGILAVRLFGRKAT